jgi:hypothetical protein
VNVDQPIGPVPALGHSGPPLGYLMVYSATEEKQNGEGTLAYPHSAYNIYSIDGQHIKSVDNHLSINDEQPEKVVLSPGTYKVKAWSENDGLMNMTVIIKGGQTTTIDLDRNNSGKGQYLSSSEAVKTPSGATIGYKAK